MHIAHKSKSKSKWYWKFEEEKKADDRGRELCRVRTRVEGGLEDSDTIVLIIEARSANYCICIILIEYYNCQGRGGRE